MVVEIGQAFDFVNVDVVHPVESFGALPLAFPVLRVGHRVGDLELVDILEQAEAFDDVKLCARGDGAAALVHPVVIVGEVVCTPDLNEHLKSTQSRAYVK